MLILVSPGSCPMCRRKSYDDPAVRYVSLADAAGAPADKLVCPEPGRDW